MDKIINTFFTQRYNYILECANNILKLIKRQDLKYELVNDAFFYISTNKEKLKEELENGKIEAVVVRWMTMQIKWNATHFKKSWVYPNKYHTQKLLPENLESYAILDDVIPEEELHETEIENQNKINYINTTIAKLDLDQQILFDLVYNKGINTSGKLAKHISISRTSCYYMIKELKEKLKNGYKTYKNNCN